MEILILAVLVVGYILAPPPVKSLLKWLFLVSVGVTFVVLFFPFFRRFLTGGI